MRSTITISIPPRLRAELDKLADSEGLSRGDIVRELLRDYLFVRRFRSLRQAMTAKASQRGVFTDQDEFESVS